jgi:hypothetical protein
MDLRECMGSFKKFLAFFTLGFHALLGFSATPKVVLQKDFVLIDEKNQICHQELERKIKKILNISHFKLSKSAFSKDPHLFLTNQKEELFSHKSPLQGYAGAHKIFLLHKKNNHLYISLVDSKDKPLKSELLKDCKLNGKDFK